MLNEDRDFFSAQDGEKTFTYDQVLKFVRSRKYITKQLILDEFGCSDSDCEKIFERLKKENVQNKFNNESQPLLRRASQTFGEFCEVLEPEWLKKDVCDRIERIRSQYDR